MEATKTQAFTRLKYATGFGWKASALWMIYRLLTPSTKVYKKHLLFQIEGRLDDYNIQLKFGSLNQITQSVYNYK